LNQSFVNREFQKRKFGEAFQHDVAQTAVVRELQARMAQLEQKLTELEEKLKI
jgi:polyhydroxyalkanoate synthesis regulator phasin